MNVSCPDCRSVFRVDPAKVPIGGIRARCSVCGGVMSVPAPEFTAERGVAAMPAPPAAVAAMTAASEPETGSDVEAAPEPVSDVSAERGRAAPRGPASTVDAAAVPLMRPPFNPRVRPAFFPRQTFAQAGAQQPAAPPPSPSAGATPEPATPEVATPELATPELATAEVATPEVATPEVATPSVATRAVASPVAATPVVANESVPAAGRRVINPFLANDPGQKAKRLARALVSDMVAYLPQKREEGLRNNTLKALFREEIKKSYEEYLDQVGSEVAEGTTYFQDALNDVLSGGKKIF